jgi:hypothetical protein
MVGFNCLRKQSTCLFLWKQISWPPEQLSSFWGFHTIIFLCLYKEKPMALKLWLHIEAKEFKTTTSQSTIYEYEVSGQSIIILKVLCPTSQLPSTNPWKADQGIFYSFNITWMFSMLRKHSKWHYRDSTEFSQHSHYESNCICLLWCLTWTHSDLTS